MLGGVAQRAGHSDVAVVGRLGAFNGYVGCRWAATTRSGKLVPMCMCTRLISDAGAVHVEVDAPQCRAEGVG